MTVESTLRRQFFNGGSTSYDFQIKYFAANEIMAYVDAGSGFVIVDPADYTLTANTAGEGGNILFDSATVAGTLNVFITADVPYTQGTRIPSVDRLGQGVLEGMADKQTVLAQQLLDSLSRAISLPVDFDNSDFDNEVPTPLVARRAILINADLTGFLLSTNDPDEAADLLADVQDAADTAIAAANAASSSATAAAVSAAAAAASAVAAAASATAAHNSEVAAAAIVSGAGLGTVTSVATAGLATGGTITGAGTITVTAASTTEVLVGTGTTKAVTPDALAAIWEKGAATASATTVTLPEGGWCHITGTTTIAAFANPSGASRHFTTIFDGILTLTHSASLICKGAVDILTAANDSAEWVYEGSSVWRMVRYNRTATTVDGASVTAASQAEQETGTDTTKFVSPGRQQYHPSAAKGWAKVTYSGGVPSLGVSYNVSSITDVATGTCRVNWNQDFSTANHMDTCSNGQTSMYTFIDAQAAGTTDVVSRTSGGAADDPDEFYIVAHGDQ